MQPDINICRPGFGASCALCCGSHNYLANPGEINSLFCERSLRVRDFNRDYIIRNMASSRSSMTGSYYYPGTSPFIITLPARDAGSRQCPFVGFAGNAPEAGCLLYPDNYGYGNILDCYQNYRNKIFSCGAGERLSEDEILFAARITGDWYYYSILIHSYGYLRAAMKKNSEPDKISIEDLLKMKHDLDLLFESTDEFIKMETYFN
jgi:hypothetical protein